MASGRKPFEQADCKAIRSSSLKYKAIRGSVFQFIHRSHLRLFCSFGKLIANLLPIYVAAWISHERLK